MIISLYEDIYQLVISLVSDKTTLCSILLTCKAFNFMGYKCLRNFNIYDITFWACENGNLSLLKKLLEISKINPSVHDQYLIKLAVHNGHLQVVDMLLQDPRVAKLYPSGV